MHPATDSWDRYDGQLLNIPLFLIKAPEDLAS